MSHRFLWAIGVLWAVTLVAPAQSLPTVKRDPIRLRIRSADPWAVKAMLEGQALQQPEISTIPGFGGLAASTTRAASAFFGSGKLIVNPTDNSLWFLPD